MGEPKSKAEAQNRAKHDARKGNAPPPEMKNWSKAARSNYMSQYEYEKEQQKN